MGVERQIPEDERGHDGLTSAERIKQMTQPVPVQGDLDSYWYNHQIAIVNKRNKELERRIADLAAEVEQKWDSVDERLPEKTDGLSAYRAVLVWQPEYQNIFEANWDGRKWQIFGAFGRVVEGVTHWRPLPSPPRTDQQLQPKGEQG